MNNKLLALAILIIIPGAFLFLKDLLPSHPPTNKPHVLGNYAQVRASISGSGRFNLYGYTSPQALVKMEGLGLLVTTTARDDGYFEFNNQFTPLSQTETCLSSQDTVGRLTAPVCLPPFPNQFNTTIGPVIIAPSISVNTGDAYIGDHVIITGKTVPLKRVSFAFFKDQKRSVFQELIYEMEKIVQQSIHQSANLSYDNSFARRLSIGHVPFLKSVEAFDFPGLRTTSDANGNYSLEIPTSNQSYYRLFTQVDYGNSPSQRSLTLNIKILPFWTILLTIFGIFFNALKNVLLPITFLMELIILTLIFKDWIFHPYRILKIKTLTLYRPLGMIEYDAEDKALVIEEK